MELALPITIYWDLAPGTPHDDSLLRFCDEIMDCRPLMLQLYDPSPQLGEGVRSILKRFRETQVAVSLTITSPCLSSLTDTPVDELGVKEILLTFASLVSLGKISGLPDVGLSFSVTRDNWRELPDVVSVCRERSFSRLVLPMQRLFNGGEAFLLSRIEQKILEKALAKIGGNDGLRLTIHDPFLWRSFNPGTPFPQGGCQAANTMIAIAPDRGVFPCPTLPERIGTLGLTPLKEIIDSPAKREVRDRILGYPDACSHCLEITECHGGCRGRAYVMHGSFDGIDDACQ